MSSAGGAGAPIRRMLLGTEGGLRPGRRPQTPGAWSAGRVLLVFRRRGCLMSQILVDIPTFPMMVFRLGLFWAIFPVYGLESLFQGIAEARLLEGICSGKAMRSRSMGLES